MKYNQINSDLMKSMKDNREQELYMASYPYPYYYGFNNCFNQERSYASDVLRRQYQPEQMQKSTRTVPTVVGAGASSTKGNFPPQASPMVARDHLMYETMRRYDPFSALHSAPGEASPSASENKSDRMTASEGSLTQQKNELKTKGANVAASTSSPQSSPKVILLQNGSTGMMTSSSYLQLFPTSLVYASYVHSIFMTL